MKPFGPSWRTRALFALAAAGPAVFIGMVLWQPSPVSPADEPPPIRLKFATFDPLIAEPQVPLGVNIAAVSPEERVHWIVQFKGPVEDGWKQEDRDVGAGLLDYVPEFAFIVRADGATASAV